MYQYTTSSDSDYGRKKPTIHLGKVSHKFKTTFEVTESGSSYSRERGVKPASLTCDESACTYNIKTRKKIDEDLYTDFGCKRSPRQMWKKNIRDKKGPYGKEITYGGQVDEYVIPKYGDKTLANKTKPQRFGKNSLEQTSEEFQRQKAAWNEFINQLRKKHTIVDESQTTDTLQTPSSSNSIDNNTSDEQYNSSFITAPSNCDNVLSSDVYSSENQYCIYPCSSYGRLLKLENERRNYCGLGPCSYSVDKKSKNQIRKKPIDLKFDVNTTRKKYVSTPSKTKCNNPIDTSRDKKLNARREKDINRRENIVYKNKINILKFAISDSDNSTVKKRINFKGESESLNSDTNDSTLKVIEDKLNVLIAQITSIKHNVLTNIHSCSSKSKHNIDQETNKINEKGSCCKTTMLENKNDEERSNKETVNQLIIETMGISPITQSNECNTSAHVPKIKEMLSAERNKTENGEILSNALILYDDEPTSYRGAVVASPCSKENVEKDTSLSSRERYADDSHNKRQQEVNYDPLGLFSLFKISSGTIGRMLSLVQLGCRSLLSRILPKQKTDRPPVIAFNCNVCDSSFQKSAEFNEHIIRVHKPEPSKDCCVCRPRKVEKARIPKKLSSVFKCQYCNVTFIRSYCCELHEIKCSKRQGKVHELPENLAILS